MTVEDFIEEAKQVHGDKYDYSKIIEDNITIENKKTKVPIICKIHGIFWQSVEYHLRGQGCPECANNIRLTTEEFIKRAKQVHGDKYDYSNVNYINNHTPVIIICKKHNKEFTQKPVSHLRGHGCPECAKEYKSNLFKNTKEDFIKKARQVHGDKYDYSKIEYVNSNTKVCIICKVHREEYWQTPAQHLSGRGCPKCANENSRLTQQEFIRKAKQVHGDKYDYSKTIYVNARTKITVTCLQHGDFEQYAASHLAGKGCPKCNCSFLENNIRIYLDANHIEYLEQHTWDWLTFKGQQRVDFYLPQYNVVIEAQGAQHFMNVEFFDKFEPLEIRIEKDNNKNRLCLEHGIKIYYFSNLFKDKIIRDKSFTYPYPVFEDINTLFTLILSEFNLNYNYNPIRLIGP